MIDTSSPAAPKEEASDSCSDYSTAVWWINNCDSDDLPTPDASHILIEADDGMHIVPSGSSLSSSSLPIPQIMGGDPFCWPTNWVTNTSYFCTDDRSSPEGVDVVELSPDYSTGTEHSLVPKFGPTRLSSK